jgi:hypothetical protein
MLAPAAAAAVLSVLPALAETRIEKNLKLDPGGKLTVDSDAGSLNVTGLVLRRARRAHVRQGRFESRFDLKVEELPGECASP